MPPDKKARAGGTGLEVDDATESKSRPSDSTAELDVQYREALRRLRARTELQDRLAVWLENYLERSWRAQLRLEVVGLDEVEHDLLLTEGEDLRAIMDWLSGRGGQP